MTTPERLAQSTTPGATLLHRREVTETGIVHLGLGNFHRAHQAVHTAAALQAEDGPWGILGVASRSAAVADALRAQDLRYSVLEISPEGSRVAVPAVHTGVLVAAQDREAVVDAVAGARIVTLTVTEHGYTIDPRTGSLALDHPGVRADLAGGAPQTTLGQIVRGLQRRLRAGGAPITVMSCDNLVENGTTTARLVGEFVAALPEPERAELEPYLAHVAFPNSMVDRIVPATTDAYRAEAARLLGVWDEVPVPAEPFSMWAIEDDFAAGRPAWERGGARFTTDVAGYELLKLRLLNGTHSLIAYLGALAGCDTIPQSSARSAIRAAANAVLREDYLPTVPVPADVDLEEYVAQLFTRWSNTALGHRTRQVGSDGSVKLAQRVPEPALHHLAAGRMPHGLALTVAAYLCCIAPPTGFDAGSHAAAMSDPARERLARLAGRPTAEFVAAALDTGLLGTELAAHDGFRARVAELVDLLVRHGADAAARELTHTQEAA
ncbi:mannitol dehydrogenase family protein [Pseudonocardia sp. NPDC049154]|uniref:mannitol dehydrogenase family protein n=1 Tax=Pseudonocardia sp. NPDC049154 TaxID=3155501 RepID=UPI0033C01AA0